MKTRIKLYSAWLALLFTGSSCQNETDTFAVDGQDREVCFQIGIAATKTNTDAAFKTTFQQGDAIGIFALNRETGEIWGENCLYVYQQDGSWSAEKGALYYPSDGSLLDFYAYYPYNSQLETPGEIFFEVKTDQTTAGNYAQSDFLCAVNRSTTQVEKEISLLFEHRLAMIQLTITMPPGMDTDELRNVSVVQVPIGVKIDLTNSGVVSDQLQTGLSDIRMYRFSSAPLIYRAVLPVQILSAEAGALCNFQVGFDNYSYLPDSNILLEAGKVQPFQIQLNE